MSKDIQLRNHTPDSPITRLQQLLEEGADPNTPNEIGNTCLHIAAEHSNPQTLAFLLQAGANPNLQNNEGRTPLHLVIQSYEQREQTFTNTRPTLEKAILLLQAGADPNLPTKELHNTPLHVACHIKDPLPLLQLLLPAGANPLLQNTVGETPLDILLTIAEILETNKNPQEWEVTQTAAHSLEAAALKKQRQNARQTLQAP